MPSDTRAALATIVVVPMLRVRAYATVGDTTTSPSISKRISRRMMPKILTIGRLDLLTTDSRAAMLRHEHRVGSIERDDGRDVRRVFSAAS
ncbi:MAG: hypothetical protein H6730_05225 [Deltaproteobacteria bacterium]|nr:hypothetical protein [Deltaproteobacteria bacterium]